MTPANVLIVDDQEANRKLLNGLVTALGHKPIEAETGISGLAQLRKESVDIVLLDIMMPAKNGYDVLEEMKGDGSGYPQGLCEEGHH